MFKLLTYIFYLSCLTKTILTITTDKLNIFVTYSNGSPSHVTPILTVAQELHSRGHNVTYAALSDRIQFANNYNLTNKVTLTDIYKPESSTEEEPSLREIMLDLMSRNNGKYNSKLNHKIMNILMLPNYERSLLSLINYFKNNNNNLPDIMLCDFASTSCSDISQKLGIPSIIFIQAIDTMDKTSAPYIVRGMLPMGQVTTEKLSIYQRFITQIYYRLIEYTYMIPFKRDLDNIKLSMGINTKPKVYGDPDYSLLLANSFFGLEPSLNLPPNIKLIGPLPMKRQDNSNLLIKDADLNRFVMEHSKILYIGLGTNVIVDPLEAKLILESGLLAINEGIIDGIIWGLANILEVDLPKTIKDINGNSINVSDILNYQHSDIRLLPWAPQLELLNNNNIKLYISQGGYGGIIESIQSKTPLLIIPYMGDQIRNAAKIKEIGVGLFTSRFSMTKDSLLDQIRVIVSDEDDKFKINLDRLSLVSKFGERRLNFAGDIVEEHALLAKSCRKFMPYSESSGEAPCEMLHWLPASTRMNFIRSNNLDLYGIMLLVSLGLLWSVIKLGVLIMGRVWLICFGRDEVIDDDKVKKC